MARVDGRQVNASYQDFTMGSYQRQIVKTFRTRVYCKQNDPITLPLSVRNEKQLLWAQIMYIVFFKIDWLPEDYVSIAFQKMTHE